MAGYGWRDYKSISWGKKTQDQISQTEINQGTKRRSTTCCICRWSNRHDMKMTKATLQSIVIYRPEPTIRLKQHMCLDKGYDFPEVYELLEEYGYTIHIPLRGEKRKRSNEVIPGYRARHWVVERTHSWMNRCRRFLIRWEKKVENHIAMLHYACAWITYRRAGVFG